jgi:hypothetical protein
MQIGIASLPFTNGIANNSAQWAAGDLINQNNSDYSHCFSDFSGNKSNNCRDALNAGDELAQAPSRHIFSSIQHLLKKLIFTGCYKEQQPVTKSLHTEITVNEQCSKIENHHRYSADSNKTTIGMFNNLGKTCHITLLKPQFM